jgi:hypothetical protein
VLNQIMSRCDARTRICKLEVLDEASKLRKEDSCDFTIGRAGKQN